jgi:hypothetical protein
MLSGGIDVATIVGTVLSGLAAISAWFANAHARDAKGALGEPNGNGPANDMLAKLLGMQFEQVAWQQRHDDADDTRFNRIDAYLVEINQRLTILEERNE